MIYMCSNGYMMVGDFIVVCINIGVWFVSKWFSCDFVDWKFVIDYKCYS